MVDVSGQTLQLAPPRQMGDRRLPTEKVQLEWWQGMDFCWAHLGAAVGFTALAGREHAALPGWPKEWASSPHAFEEGWRKKESKVTCPVNGIMKATLQRLAPLCIQREQTPVALISIFMETLYSKWQSCPASFDTRCNNKYLCCISLH